MKLMSFTVKLITVVLIAGLLALPAWSKDKKAKGDEPAYTFTVDKELPRTPVKDQYWTGTCWCFATTSFLESELIRLGKGETDLSEIYTVRGAYPLKALNYIQMHGDANFGQGGQAHDVFDTMALNGAVPESVYSGMNIGENRHNHGEMMSVLTGILDAVLKNNNGRKLTPRWLDAVNAVLDVYLGKSPETFSYKDKTYTPQSFAAEFMGLNPADYIELTSYSHHPWYKQCRLEIPDNWNYNSNYYNLPLDEFEAVAENSIKNGYTLVWDGDVSERDFSPGGSPTEYGAGYAIVPEKDWDDMTRAERKVKISAPFKEKTITPELRQETFNNHSTTDDHLMHLVGIAHDQTGARFYLIKNSGGEDRAYKGYLYMSSAYFRLKTTAMMVHKDALPNELKAKLGL